MPTNRRSQPTNEGNLPILSENLRVERGTAHGLPTLTDLIEDNVGHGRRWPSERQLSLKAGLNENAVSKIRERGSADPETLLKLAPLLGLTPRQMFEIARWLPLEPDARDPAIDEAARLVDALPPELREVALSALRGIVQGLQEPSYQRQALRYLRAADRPESSE